MQVSGAALAPKRRRASGWRSRSRPASRRREVVNSVTRRYDTGGASNVDLIDVQTAYTSAQTDLITALV